MNILFLIAPLNRSGTHLLRETLINCNKIKRGRLPEDYILKNIKLLETFTEDTCNHWFDPEGNRKERLKSNIKSSILDVLSESEIGKNDWLMLITPRAFGISEFQYFFSGAKFVFLSRNGRDTVESAVKSFPELGLWGWSKQYHSGCKQIDEFKKKNSSSNYIDVSFEDLVQNPMIVVNCILEFLKIESSEESLDVSNIPILGSGFERGKSKELHWEPVEKTKAFNPVGRSASWGIKNKLKFKFAKFFI